MEMTMPTAEEKEKELAECTAKLLPTGMRHPRAGITKNHGNGQSKSRRKMASRSRCINRG